MTLGKQLTERLRLLAKEGPAGAQLQAADESYTLLSVTSGDTGACLELFDYDRYSVTMRSLEVATAHATDEAVSAADGVRALLSSRAAAVARQLSYLEEPLAVWELDCDEQLVQMRSSPPLRDGDEVSYWEVTLSIGEQSSAKLARYRWEPGMIEREVVDYPATFALAARIADSLDAALKD